MPMVLEQLAIIRDIGVCIRMLMPGDVTKPSNDRGLCPVPHERLGLAQPVRVLEQLSQVIEISGDVRVIRSERRLRRWPAAPAA